MEAARTSETSVDNYFTQKYIPEDKSGLYWMFFVSAADSWGLPVGLLTGRVKYTHNDYGINFDAKQQLELRCLHCVHNVITKSYLVMKQEVLR
jgi:hypothetical protein